MMRAGNVLMATLVLAPFAAPGKSPSDNWKSLYESLKSPVLADSGWSLTDTVAMRFPDFSIQFLSGEIAPLQSQNGTTGWIFEGEANLRFAPRYLLEQQQLKRFTGDTVLTCTSRQLVMRFTAKVASSAMGIDSLGKSPAHPLTRSPSLPLSLSASPPLILKAHHLSDQARQLDNHLQSLLLLRHGDNLAARLLVAELGEADDDFLVCAFQPSSATDFAPPLYLYSNDAGEREAVRLYQFHEQRAGQPFYTVCQYGLSDLTSASSDSLAPAVPPLTKYNGWVETRPGGDIGVDMGCDIFLNRVPLPFLRFDLNREMTVQSIRNESGDTLAFIQEPGESALTLVAPAPAPIDTLRLLISYQGRGLNAGTGTEVYLSDPVYWLPRLGYLRRASHKIVVKYPDGVNLVGAGRVSAPWRDRGFTLRYLNARTPAKAFAFAYGRFIEDSTRVRPDLALQVFSTPAHSATARRRVLENLRTALAFFEARLGPYPLPYLRVLEAPGIDSQGLPGMLMLSWVSFRAPQASATKTLLGHELAHQWFGNMVGWATYHDQWLSEAIAEYLGAAFLESVPEGAKYFSRLLEAWRDDLLSGRHLTSSAGMERLGVPGKSLAKSEGRAAGPIWMGFRLGEKQGIDYYLQTYEKGAWVIHMLRRQLTDPATGDDQGFWNMLADFYRTYADRDPTTSDFQAVVERHAAMPMDWFFRQWVYGTDIPHYEWNTRTEKLGSNEFVVRGIVRQGNTGADFRVPVPIAFDFGNNERRIERVWVGGNETSFAVTLSRKPRQIIFNYGSAVLCEERKKDISIPPAGSANE